MSIRSLGIALAVLLATPAGADQFTEEERAFEKRWSDQPLLVFAEQHRLEVNHQRSGSGVEGRWEMKTDYLVRDREAIETVSRQVRVRGPVFEATEFEVEVLHASGKRSRLREGDLQWVQVPAGAGGVYTTDRIIEYTVVPRIAVGDRVRVREIYAIRGTHGIPELTMGLLKGVPVLRSTAEVVYPHDHELVSELVGRRELTERVEVHRRDNGTRWVDSWTLENFFTEEGAWRSPLSGVHGVRWVGHFSAVGERAAGSLASGADWAETGGAYLAIAEGKILPDSAIVAEAWEVIGTATSDSEKARILYEHVQRECRYLGLFDGLGGLIPESAVVTSNRRYGDCKGLSVFLLALLRSVGIEAWPALVRTAQEGPFATSVPNLTQFNHFIVFARIDGEELWMDPVYDFCPAGLVPLDDARNPALKLEHGDIGLVEISASHAPAGEYTYTVEGELWNDGRGDLQIRERATDNAALRRRLWRATEDEAGLLDGIIELLGSPVLRSANAETRLEEQPGFADAWELDLQFRDVVLGTPAGSSLYLPLQLVDLFRLSFDADERTEPLELRGMPSVTMRWSFRVSEGWTLDPVARERTGPGVRWALRATLEEGVLKLSRDIRFEPLTLSADEARELGELLEEIREVEDGYLELRRTGAGR